MSTINGKNAIYKVVGPNWKGWAKDVSHKNSNYDYLMFGDLDYSNPEVRQDVLNWVEWIGRELPLSGIRLDAIKHFSFGFQRSLILAAPLVPIGLLLGSTGPAISKSSFCTCEEWITA